MKTRGGFVSNSSSSSFIVAVKSTEERCPCCKQTLNPLVGMLENPPVDSEVIGENLQEVVADIQKDLSDIEADIARSSGDRDLSWLLSEREQLTNLLVTLEAYRDDPAWKVCRISLSYHDENLRNLLSTTVRNGKAFILHTDDC